MIAELGIRTGTHSMFTTLIRFFPKPTRDPIGPRWFIAHLKTTLHDSQRDRNVSCDTDIKLVSSPAALQVANDNRVLNSSKATRLNQTEGA